MRCEHTRTFRFGVVAAQDSAAGTHLFCTDMIPVAPMTECGIIKYVYAIVRCPMHVLSSRYPFMCACVFVHASLCRAIEGHFGPCSGSKGAPEEQSPIHAAA